MTRLLLFVAFLISLGFAVSLSSLKSLPTNNRPFDMKAAEQAYAQHQKEIQLAMNPPAEAETSEATEVEAKVIEIALDTPQLKNGHEVYTKKGQCLTCHGKNGEGKKSQKAPRVASQHDWYLETQLINMKKGIRVNEKMNPYLTKLSEQDLKDVAHYLSKFPSWK